MTAIPFTGIISDRIGRRMTLIKATATMLILAYPCFLLISQGSFLAAVVGQVLLAIPASATAANQLAAQTEMFPTRIRYTAYAIAMNVGVALFGGTAPFVATYLISATGSNLAPAFYLMFAAALSLITALVMTETAKEPLPDV
jgi:MFS transporter, MHS family, proline/betaine transporter